jgi:hypothetical protein
MDENPYEAAQVEEPQSELAVPPARGLSAIRYLAVAGCAVLALLGLAIAVVGLEEVVAGRSIIGWLGSAWAGLWFLLAERLGRRQAAQ